MLDEKDQLILKYLMHDCRISTSKLAKITRLAQSTVVYRIQNLESKGFIGKYDAILNINRISLRKEIFFISVPKESKEKFEKYVEQSKFATSFFKLLDKYNYWTFCFFKDERQRKDFIDYLEENNCEFESYDMQRAIIQAFSLNDLNIDFKFKAKKNKDIKLDEVDIKLLKILCDGGGRDSVLDLNKKIKINYDTLLYKFKRLKSSGYLNLFVAMPSRKQFSLQYDFVLFRTRSLEFQEFCRILSPIRQAYIIIDLGNGVYLTQILTLSFQEYKNVIESISDLFRSKINEFKVYNTKDYLFTNRYPLEWLI